MGTRKCTKCGSAGHAAQDHAWDPELRAADRAGLAPRDIDTVIAVLLATDLAELEGGN